MYLATQMDLAKHLAATLAMLPLILQSKVTNLHIVFVWPMQVLLSQVHRLRALVLLGRFLDMGSWAVDLALSVGIFPYVLKLLQTTSSDLRTTLVFIWAKILALDRSCQADLVKDNGHLYFLKYLDSPEPGIDNHNRAQAAFVLAVVCDHHAKGQALCAAANLLQVRVCVRSAAANQRAVDVDKLGAVS
jgi:hypothetical protein